MFDIIPEKQFCFKIPKCVKVLWSTRAIYERKYGLTVVQDRNQIFSTDKKEYDKLLNWLIKSGWPNFKKKVEESNITENSYEEIIYSDDKYIITGTPNSSYGYFYIIAHPIVLKEKEND